MPKAASAARGYGRGAAILSVAIGATGVITFAYFSVASHVLPAEQYGQVALLWSAIFITVSVLYRPVEQLLSRTIADRDVRGVGGSEHLRVAATIQLGLGILFAVVALLLRQPLQDDLFDGSAALYWILIVAVLAYAASYFARGFLAGHRRFGLYGGLVLMESDLALPVRARRGRRDRARSDGRGARHGRRADRVADRGRAGAGQPPQPASVGLRRRRRRPRQRRLPRPLGSRSSPSRRAPGSPWRCSPSCWRSRPS